MERKIHVYMDRRGGPALVGHLWVRRRQGQESATFIYDSNWLRHPDRFALEPELPLDPAPHHTSPGIPLFGSLRDSAPDRWGRELIRRQRRREASGGSAKPRTLAELDYLLQVSDAARLGALRFTASEGGDFLAPEEAARIPPAVSLPALLNASEEVMAGEQSDAWLPILLAPGSSLGGARPKAAVRGAGGKLAIAKFPAQADVMDVVRWEAVALRMAQQAGVPVPDWRLESVNGKPVLMLAKFDREGVSRLPFLSAMAALGAKDHESRSYLEFVDFLRQHGARPREDLRTLWRRIVFNVLISNTDDHLRNHGFLHVLGAGWTLAPAYDLNPVPEDIKPRILSTAIDFEDSEASLERALAAAPYFDLEAVEARKIAREVGQVTASWRLAAAHLGIASEESARMSSAFEHADLEFALR